MHATLRLGHARASVLSTVYPFVGGYLGAPRLHCGPGNFLSENVHFAKSALARYGPRHFLELVNRYGIAWHEKKLGQLFCDHSAQAIVDMLLEEGVSLKQASAIIARLTGRSRREVYQEGLKKRSEE